jgi:hypothetical protein
MVKLEPTTNQTIFKVIKFKRTYHEDGSLADEQGFFGKEIINKIVS